MPSNPKSNQPDPLSPPTSSLTTTTTTGNNNTSTAVTLTTTLKPTLEPLTIQFSEPYWEKMSRLVHVFALLKGDGYKVKELKWDDLLGLRRCRDCRVRVGSRNWRERKGDKSLKKDTNDNNNDIQGDIDATTSELSAQLSQIGFSADHHPDADDDAGKAHVTVAEVNETEDFQIAETARVLAQYAAEDDKGRKKKKSGVCQFHPGKVVAKHFTCCKLHFSKPGCVISPNHDIRVYDPVEFENGWKLHETPVDSADISSHRKAVALDCEMGVSKYGDSELVRITAVDHFTGEILIDSLVYPSVPMLHLNTRYSGVDRRTLEQARRTGQCIEGRDQARERLWEFVGPETILVMHGGGADLTSLRWIHRRVIDTRVVEKGRKEPIQGLSLKNLAEVLLKTRIQEKGKAHDSLEDALACRALLHWYVENL